MKLPEMLWFICQACPCKCEWVCLQLPMMSLRLPLLVPRVAGHPHIHGPGSIAGARAPGTLVLA